MRSYEQYQVGCGHIMRVEDEKFLAAVTTLSPDAKRLQKVLAGIPRLTPADFEFLVGCLEARTDRTAAGRGLAALEAVGEAQTPGFDFSR